MSEDLIEQNKSKKNEKKGNNIVLIMFKYFNYVIIITIAIIFIIGISYLIGPKYNKITNGVEEVNKNKLIQKDDMTNYLSQLSRYRQSYNEIDRQTRERVNQFLPSEKEHEHLFTDMESLINRRGLILRDIEITSGDETKSNRNVPQAPNKGITSAGVGIVNMKLNITGVDYEELKQLLDTFESNLRLMDIIDVNFSPGDKSLSLGIKTYYNK